MRRLTTAKRIALAGVLMLLLATGAFFALFSQELSSEIAVAEAEGDRNRFARPVEEILQLSAEHQLTAQRSEAGDGDAARALPRLEFQTDQAFDELMESDRTLEDSLRRTPEVADRSPAHLPARSSTRSLAQSPAHTSIEGLKQEWAAVENLSSAETPALFDQGHEHLRSGLHDLLAREASPLPTGPLAAPSGSTFAPPGDVFGTRPSSPPLRLSLGEITSKTLPEAQQRLGEITALGHTIFASGEHLRDDALREEQRRDLMAKALLWQQADLGPAARLSRSFWTEGNNASPYGSSAQADLLQAVARYEAAKGALLALVARMLRPSIGPVTAAEFSVTASAARRTGFALWQASSWELENLLARRIEALSRLRLLSLTLASAALLVGLVLVVFLCRAVWRRIGERIGLGTPAGTEARIGVLIRVGRPPQPLRDDTPRLPGPSGRGTASGRGPVYGRGLAPGRGLPSGREAATIEATAHLTAVAGPSAARG